MKALMLAIGMALCAWTDVSADPQDRRPGRPRVLDLSLVPIELDEPGHYVFDRSWDVGLEAGNHATIINVVADDVLIDLRGFELKYANNGAGIGIGGNRGTVRNGRIIGETSQPVNVSGDFALLEQLHLEGGAGSALHIGGEGSILRNSTYIGDFAIALFRSGNRIESNVLTCRSLCIIVPDGADGAEIRGNRITAGLDPDDNHAILVEADGSLVVDNVLHNTGIIVSGSRSYVLNNTLFLGPPRDRDVTAIIVAGVDASLAPVSGNVIRGNLAAPSNDGRRWGVGLSLRNDGQFFGRNEMAAAVPFDVGATVQTDWGGNVGF